MTHFLGLTESEREKEGEKETKASLFDLQSSICQISSGQDKSSSHQQGLHVGTKREGFRRDPKEEIRGKSKFSGLRGVLGTFYRLDYVSRGRDSFYSSFSLHLFVDFWVKKVECAKGLLRQKNAQKLKIFA